MTKLISAIIVALIVVFAVAITAPPNFAGAKRQLDLNGSATVTIDGVDTAGATNTVYMRLNQDNSNTNPDIPRYWNILKGEIYVTDFAETDSTIAGESVLDTAYVWVYTTWGNYTRTLIDSAVMAGLPETLSFTYYNEIMPSDTLANGVLGGGYPYQTGLIGDNIYVRYRMADTAGSSGSLAATVYYRFRFIELE